MPRVVVYPSTSTGKRSGPMCGVNRAPLKRPTFDARASPLPCRAGWRGAFVPGEYLPFKEQDDVLRMFCAVSACKIDQAEHHRPGMPLPAAIVTAALAFLRPRDLVGLDAAGGVTQECHACRPLLGLAIGLD